MHLLALDLETTGLDGNTDQILEVGAIAVDFAKPKERHIFQRYISHSAYQGNATALSMNAAALRAIGGLERDRDKGNDVSGMLVNLEDLLPALLAFIYSLPFFNVVEKWTLTGKNVGSFDLSFLRQVPGWNRFATAARIGHRCLDPGPLWMSPTDTVMPDLATCLRRAGIAKDIEHTAVADCTDVLNVIFASFKPAIHLKTGNQYWVRGKGLDTDNINKDTDPKFRVSYTNGDGYFNRSLEEFNEKFGW